MPNHLGELRTRLLGFALTAGVVLVAFGARGCAALHPSVEQLANGDFHVACREPLAPCLVPVADRCAEHGFDVIYATERRQTTGAPPEQEMTVRSEATVRCRQAKPLVGPNPNASASAAAAPLGPPRCVPGVSQACATPAGCMGAQVCTEDGKRFGPCVCAPAAAQSSAPDSPSDAGAP
jgi:hypothetical protein